MFYNLILEIYNANAIKNIEKQNVYLLKYTKGKKILSPIYFSAMNEKNIIYTKRSLSKSETLIYKVTTCFLNKIKDKNMFPKRTIKVSLEGPEYENIVAMLEQYKQEKWLRYK